MMAVCLWISRTSRQNPQCRPPACSQSLFGKQKTRWIRAICASPREKVGEHAGKQVKFERTIGTLVMTRHANHRTTVSALMGTAVIDAHGATFGHVREVAVAPSVDSAHVHGIVLKRTSPTALPEDENFLLLERDLLDQQIIDVHGHKVVRVNDVDLVWEPAQDGSPALSLRIAEVEVTSARQLSAEQAKQLQLVLERRLGLSVRLHAQVDKSLLGGAIVRYGDFVVDGSLRGRRAAWRGRWLRRCRRRRCRRWRRRRGALRRLKNSSSRRWQSCEDRPSPLAQLRPAQGWE